MEENAVFENQRDKIAFSKKLKKTLEKVWWIREKSLPLHSLSEREARDLIFDRLRTEERQAAHMYINNKYMHKRQVIPIEYKNEQ